MDRLFTVGVYGFDAGSFFDALQRARIDLFLDLRRRRGVRGRVYSFANAGRLTAELELREIAYRHVIELAPDLATRELQRQEDALGRVSARKRTALGETFIADYTRRTLDPFDWDALIAELAQFQRPVLFCVETEPRACHRSLAAARLAGATLVPVTNLTP